MYATKDNAFNNSTEDKHYGRKRILEYVTKFKRDRGMKYFFLATFTLMAFVGSKLWQLQEEMKRMDGILGPKKKSFRSRLTVVLDVDETIVSYGDKAYRMRAGMVCRPYLAELLDYLCSIDAEVVMWSAASDRYLSQVLSVIDPSGQRVSNVLSRSSDWFTGDHYYEKNIAWLKRDLNNTLIIENRPASVRGCNGNAILVDDFLRGEYMDTGQDHPANDKALRIIKEVIQDLETTGRPVPEYLADRAKRHKDLKEIPCHYAMRQMPDELARGVFYFVGDKYKPNQVSPKNAKY